MKLSQKLQLDVVSNLTTSKGPSGMSMSSTTPGRHLDDMCVLMSDLHETFKDSSDGYNL